MDILRLYDDYGIQYKTTGHKHCRPGWVNTECPFCTGNPGLHLGFCFENEIFVCWRCGWKPKTKAIAKLLHVTEAEAREIIKRYGGRSTPPKPQQVQVFLNKKPFKFPSNTGPLGPQHKAYLKARGLNPEYLQKVWQVQGTGPVSKLDNIDYRNRILIPISWNNEIVSFQTRDITGKHPAKYMACPEYREKIKHKHILYGHPSIWQKDSCICAEGVFDVWKLGRRAVATFGIKYTPKQLRILSQFKKVVVFFDADPQAIIQAQKLVSELLFRKVDASMYYLKDKKDPGSLNKAEARQIINYLLDQNML